MKSDHSPGDFELWARDVSQPMSYDITGRNRVKVSSGGFCEQLREMGWMLSQRWEVRDSHGFGCDSEFQSWMR